MGRIPVKQGVVNVSSQVNIYVSPCKKSGRGNIKQGTAKM